MRVMTTNDKGLAAMVALRLDGHPQDKCAAWVESKDRACDREAVRPWLCKRHETVAQRRLDKEAEKGRARREAAREKAAQERPQLQARLEKVEARLQQIDPFLRTDLPADTAMVNVPLAKRLPSDSRIHELAGLHAEAESLRARLERGESR